MKDILLFAGTTEGKQAVDFMEALGVSCYVSVATAYGGQVLDGILRDCELLVGRMDACQIADFLRRKRIALVIDATHPYAVEVTKNARDACSACGVQYLRIIRKKDARLKRALYFPDMEEVAQYLCSNGGNVLLTTGSKDLAVFARIKDFQDRIYARILPARQSVQAALDAGYCTEHLFCGQGPFSIQQNMEMIRQCGARYLVSKDTGDAGGFREKAQAAEALGVLFLVVERPQETGITIEQLKLYLKGRICNDAENYDCGYGERKREDDCRLRRACGTGQKGDENCRV